MHSNPDQQVSPFLNWVKRLTFLFAVWLTEIWLLTTWPRGCLPVSLIHYWVHFRHVNTIVWSWSPRGRIWGLVCMHNVDSLGHPLVWVHVWERGHVGRKGRKGLHADHCCRGRPSRCRRRRRYDHVGVINNVQGVEIGSRCGCWWCGDLAEVHQARRWWGRLDVSCRGRMGWGHSVVLQLANRVPGMKG